MPGPYSNTTHLVNIVPVPLSSPPQTNFNPIDFTMGARDCDFVEAVQYLTTFLPAAGGTPRD